MRGSIQKRVQKNGAASYSVIVDLPRGADGKRNLKRVGTVKTKREAEQLLAKALHELNTGSFVEPSTVTVGQWLEQWLATVEPRLKSSTFCTYRRIVNGHLIPVFGAVLLTKLTPAMIERQYAAWLAEGVSPTTVRHRHVRLSTALSKAVRQKLIHTNPAAGDVIDVPRPANTEMKVWSAEQVRAFFAFTAEDRLAALWRLALETGMRRGELLGLRWSDLDLEAGTLAVQQALTVDRDGKSTLGTPKTAASSRQVGLLAGTVAALHRHRARQRESRLAMGNAWEDRGLVFTTELGAPLETNSVGWAWTRAIRRAGLPHIRLHDARHSHATLLIAAGTPTKVVAERLGHSSVQTTLQRYAHVTPGMQRDAVERLERLLGTG